MEIKHGLKNHEIRELVNAITKYLKTSSVGKHPVILKDYQPLREIIAHAVLEFLKKENLFLDKRYNSNSES